jgi:hypothetical protein
MRTSGSSDSNPRLLSEADARKVAAAWIASGQFAVEMTTGRVTETDRAWIFEVVAISGEVLLGNAPLVVDKARRSAEPCPEASREFCAELTLGDRLRRWWQRGRLY